MLPHPDLSGLGQKLDSAMDFTSRGMGHRTVELPKNFGAGVDHDTELSNFILRKEI